MVADVIRRPARVAPRCRPPLGHREPARFAYRPGSPTLDFPWLLGFQRCSRGAPQTARCVVVSGWRTRDFVTAIAGIVGPPQYRCGGSRRLPEDEFPSFLTKEQLLDEPMLLGARR